MGRKYVKVRSPCPQPTQAIVIDGRYRVHHEKTNGHWYFVVEAVETRDGEIVPARWASPVEVLMMEMN